MGTTDIVVAGLAVLNACGLFAAALADRAMGRGRLGTLALRLGGSGRSRVPHRIGASARRGIPAPRHAFDGSRR